MNENNLIAYSSKIPSNEYKKCSINLDNYLDEEFEITIIFHGEKFDIDMNKVYDILKTLRKADV